MRGSSSRTRSLCRSPHRSERPRDATHLRGFFADDSLINITPLISCSRMPQVTSLEIMTFVTETKYFYEEIFIRLRLLESCTRLVNFGNILFTYLFFQTTNMFLKVKVSYFVYELNVRKPLKVESLAHICIYILIHIEIL